jgi:carbon monoxide dehydrogenase subunit G
MKHVRRSIRVARPREVVWEVVRDVATWPRFFVGVTGWEPAGEEDCHHVVLHVGSSSLGGVVRIGGRVPGERIDWQSERGPEHVGAFTLADDGGGCLVSLDLGFQLAGGLVSRLVQELSSQIVGRLEVATLEALRHHCEWEAGTAERGPG